jgi:hypothetical protein
MKKDLSGSLVVEHPEALSAGPYRECALYHGVMIFYT